MIQGTGGPTPCELTQPFKKTKQLNKKWHFEPKKYEIRVTLLGARPAENYEQHYNYALTSRWGVRPPSPSKETKNLIAQYSADLF